MIVRTCRSAGDLLRANIDKINFVATLLIILLVSVPLILNPVAGAAIVQQSYLFISVNFGWVYLLSGMGAFLLLLWLAFGRFGKVLLGAPGEAPEFSTYSWVAMLFCAGVGAGLMYWSAIEWASYYQAPPFGAEPESVEAAKWASSYGIFHWGLIAWSFYCLPTLAIAYPFYTQNVPVLKYSIACHYWLKGHEGSAPARLMDFLFMIALIGGAGSSLGFSTPLIAALISRLTGIEAGFGLEVFVVGICVVAFATSVFLGLQKGIKRLSDINMFLALLLLAFIFVAGPTLFIVKTSLNGVGTMIQNFVAMSSWTDPFTDSGFVEDWTIFYWAWWVAYGPFVGLFVTRISRGRTIRQVVVGMLLYGSLGGALFYMVLGNYSLSLQLAGEVDVLAVMAQSGGNQAIVAGFDRLPLAEFAIALFCIVSIIFSATTYDSASYTLASTASRELHPSEDPSRWHRSFWAFALAILPITLMYIGGLRVAQTAVLVVSLPILLTSILSAVALVKSLQRDHR
jgi:BCCT family betaine/carnitine transporter